MESEAAFRPTPAHLRAVLADRYRIERELGAGGMATVYLARDLKHDREVAIKVLRPELAAVLGSERFLNEIRISARLDHPHILTLIDSGAADGTVYYVLPFVRGESLRQRLARDGPLPIPDALRIITQVASALDYAHREGVIHRDLKPENILFQEEMAMLADFGIALAVKEAGGQRLTETGLSLGTPQYMSPEQATGDRKIDARSNVYSLAAVLYEMLAGDPPHMGSTVQAVIAKLVTERPTPLRVLRETVPVEVDRSVARALSKLPADRYASAGEFARALTVSDAPGRRRARGPIARRIAFGVLGLIGAGALAIGRWGPIGGRHARVALSDRTQFTSTGRVRQVAISADGRQVAYGTRECDGTGCPRALEIANLDGSATRELLPDATSIDAIHWSPDRRELLVLATIGGRVGNYLLPTLGGAPRYVNSGDAEFFANGDSLLLAPPASHDSGFWIGVAAFDGGVRDSIRVAAPGDGIIAPRAVPGTPWFTVGVLRLPSVDLRVIDRQGRVRDHRLISTNGQLRASHDAVWWTDREAALVIRQPLDARTGRLSASVDTVSPSGFQSFDVTADGGRLVGVQGFVIRDFYAVEFNDLLRGVLSAGRRLMHDVTAPMAASISDDGQRLLLMSDAGGSNARLFTIPFAGGSKSPLMSHGKVITIGWADSATIFLVEQESGKTRFVRMDAASGGRRDELTLVDRITEDAVAPLPRAGWAWIPADGRSIRIQTSGAAAPNVVPAPDWYGALTSIGVAVDGKRLYFGGSNPNFDSTRLSVVALAGGAATAWSTMSEGWFASLADGSFLAVATSGPRREFSRLRRPGARERIGTFSPKDGAPWQLSVTPDLKRATVLMGYARGDAWIWRVGPR